MSNLVIFHLQYKHSGTFANRKYEELCYPTNQKICNPILVTLLKMRHPVPSSGTSPFRINLGHGRRHGLGQRQRFGICEHLSTHNLSQVAALHTPSEVLQGR